MKILNENSTFSEWGERWKKRVLIDATYTYTHDINSQLNHIYRYVGGISISQINLMELDEMMIDLAIENPNTHKPMSKRP